MSPGEQATSSTRVYAFPQGCLTAARFFLHIVPENSSCSGFLNFVFSTQQGCWALFGLFLTTLRPGNCLQGKAEGENQKAHFIISFP